MDDIREALELIKDHAEAFICDASNDDPCFYIFKQAAEALAAPKWTFPDEYTPGEAAVWWLLGDYWNVATWEERRHMNRSYVVDNVEPRPCVLARFNEGPPTPEETRQIMERADEI